MQLVTYLVKKLLASHSTGSIGYYSCLIIQTQFQLGRCIRACTNEIYSLANLQDLILTLAGIIISNANKPKQGLNLVDLLEYVTFVHTSMYLPSWNCVCMIKHKQQLMLPVEWEASKFLSQRASTCLIAIPTSFLKFYYFQYYNYFKWLQEKWLSMNYNSGNTFIGKSNPEEDLCRLTPKLAEPLKHKQNSNL